MTHEELRDRFEAKLKRSEFGAAITTSIPKDRIGRGPMVPSKTRLTVRSDAYAVLNAIEDLAQRNGLYFDRIGNDALVIRF